MAFRALGTFSVNTTNLVPGRPVGVAALDDLLALVVLDPAGTVTPPTGVGTWSLLASGRFGTDGQSYWLYWRPATASEPASETWVVSSAVGAGAVVGAWSGRNSSATPTVSAVTTAASGAANGAAITAASLTPPANADLAIFFIGDGPVANHDWWGSFASAGYTDAGHPIGSGYADLSVSIKDNVGAGATGVVSGTLVEGASSGGTAGWGTLHVYMPTAAAASSMGPVGWFKYLLSIGVFTLAGAPPAGTGTFAMNWDTPQLGADDSAITGYEAYQQLATDDAYFGPWTLAASLGSTLRTYTFTALANGVAQRFMVLAVNANGKSPVTAPVENTPA